jgi:hypothetical protein
MEQQRLFPPPGGMATPLPTDRIADVREVLAEMLVAVIDNKEGQHTSREGEADE